jgi:outer membrane protein assembly factor BamD (BamD/ComL family)
MKVRSHIYPLFAIVLLVITSQHSFAQPPPFSVDVKKEKPFEERKLKAEKTGEGKAKLFKQVFTNLTTRYNYYFNANNKFNEVIDRARAQQKDDYSQLLSFYSYSLDATAADSAQLDSVIYKCKNGIINHDLRNEWGDELYLLWAASWHLQKKLDSARMMLQFINYAYAPQDENGYYTYIGTRKEGAQELTIATKEEKKFLHSNTFSRNNAFIWQIRTLIELDNFATSGSLITTLKRDPVFPKRLKNALEEVEAYWYYKQQRWDSGAFYLIEAIDGAGNKREKARWNYLAAQLMERAGKPGRAAELYAKAISQTPDPVMEVYGRLNLVRINKEGEENAIDKNVAELLKMAKKDKYEEYRDIIYYMAAQMEMERNNIDAAQKLLMEGAKYRNGNIVSRNKAILQIADVSFQQKKYLLAAAFYDSLQVNDLSEEEAQRVFQRKPPLQIIAENSRVISRQDSLQRIVSMPQTERDDYINKLVKQLRKQQGLKDDAGPTAGNQFAGAQQTDLFTSGPKKGIWDNPSIRTRAANEFKQVWGNRPNVDNWRRFAVVSQQLANRNISKDPNNPNTPADQVQNTEITFETLSAKLPLTPEAIKASNDSIKNALFNLGAAYLNGLEDYASAIETFEEIRRRFPDADKMDELLFNLYFAYTKSGNTSKAAQVKKLLLDKYPSSRYAAILTTGKDPQAKTTGSPEATKAYENVYNLFIEGRFEEAITAKNLADSTYKTTFWQPQLLYIEAVYNIKQRQDSAAKKALQTIVNQNTSQALTAKAQNLLNVLSRRQQIEDELNKYQMQNQPDTASRKIDTLVKRPNVPVQQTTIKKDTTITKPQDKKNAVDTLVKKPQVQRPLDTLVKKYPPPPKSNSIYSFVPDAPHFAVVILDKVDPVFVNEGKNAFFRFTREKYYGQPLELQTISLTNDIKLLLVSGFANAQAATDYAQRAKALAPSEIVPWLTGNKYTFSIISNSNLEILKTATDIGVYKKFLETYLPGKF